MKIFCLHLHQKRIHVFINRRVCYPGYKYGSDQKRLNTGETLHSGENGNIKKIDQPCSGGRGSQFMHHTRRNDQNLTWHDSVMDTIYLGIIVIINGKDDFQYSMPVCRITFWNIIVPYPQGRIFRKSNNFFFFFI